MVMTLNEFLSQLEIEFVLLQEVSSKFNPKSKSSLMNLTNKKEMYQNIVIQIIFKLP